MPNQHRQCPPFQFGRYQREQRVAALWAHFQQMTPDTYRQIGGTRTQIAGIMTCQAIDWQQCCKRHCWSQNSGCVGLASACRLQAICPSTTWAAAICCPASALGWVPRGLFTLSHDHYVRRYPICKLTVGDLVKLVSFSIFPLCFAAHDLWMVVHPCVFTRHFCREKSFFRVIQALRARIHPGPLVEHKAAPTV